MRKIQPNLHCPKCGIGTMGIVTDEGGVWGVSDCSNIECPHYMDVHELVYKKNQKIINV